MRWSRSIACFIGSAGFNRFAGFAGFNRLVGSGGFDRFAGFIGALAASGARALSRRAATAWGVRAGAVAVVWFASSMLWVSVAAAGERLDAGVENPFELPGTQPGDLTKRLREPDVCESCHGGYADYAATDSWQGTMMANAARDPLFQAALAIANQDVPGSGDLCLRCHTPRAWLFGRSSPPQLSTLVEEDYESVDCDFCHRLEPTSPASIGNGQYTVADDFVRRGPFEDSRSDHEAAYSEYHEQSELCGLCHDVSNPAQGGFPIERTYTEWKNSAFPAEGQSCQSCHMPSRSGYAGGAKNLPERTVHEHELAGGNTWVPRVLAGEFPELDRAAAFERTARAAQQQLQSAARLSLVETPPITPGSAYRFVVRVENLTGHKLPTGYPEGRRCWLEVKVTDPLGRVLLHSGQYDRGTARRLEDEQLRTYEVEMGVDGTAGFHFVLQNELLQDNRIPPRGFRVGPDTQPVGRDYEVLEWSDAGVVLAHWDLAAYEVAVPPDLNGPLHLEVRLWYQTTSREYVEFLRDENHSDSTGQRMYALWDKYERSPPVLMTALLARLPSAGDLMGPNETPPDRDPPDAGVDIEVEAGSETPSDASTRDAGGRDSGDGENDAAASSTPDSGDLDGSDASGYHRPRNGESHRTTGSCACSAPTTQPTFPVCIVGLLALTSIRRKRRKA